MRGIVADALKYGSAKLRKSFKTAFILMMILYMVIPRKINFTQMGAILTVASNASGNSMSATASTGWGSTRH